MSKHTDEALVTTSAIEKKHRRVIPTARTRRRFMDHRAGPSQRTCETRACWRGVDCLEHEWGNVLFVVISIEHRRCGFCTFGIRGGVGSREGERVLPVADRWGVVCVDVCDLVRPLTENGTSVFAWRCHRRGCEGLPWPSRDCEGGSRRWGRRLEGVEDGCGRQDKRMHQALMTGMTRFQTPPSQRDASFIEST